jgi:hypothetical protein
MFCHQSPTRACVTGNGEVRSLWDNVASSSRTATEARATLVTASLKAVRS